jgi:N-methylhydantoinase B
MDPVFLSLLNGQLQQVLDEMEAMLRAHAAASLGHALLDPATGALLWQSRMMRPIAAGAMMAGALRLIAGHHSSDDAVIIKPIVHDGTVLCLLASVRDAEGEAACAHGERVLERIVGRFGADKVRSGIDALTAQGAAALRKTIGGLPDGRGSADDWLDNDGVDDRPIKIALDLEIRGGEIVLDFGRSAAVAAGPVNIDRATTIAACHVALDCVLGLQTAGAFTALRIIVPDGSVVAAGTSVSSAAAAQTVLRVCDVVAAALAAAMPDAGVAPGLGAANEVTLRHGQHPPMTATFGGGFGARVDRDGTNIGGSPFAELPSSEVLEVTHPVMVATYALRPDSGGTGRYRGGLGAVYELEARSTGSSASIVGDRGKYGPPGVRGGRPGAANRILWWDGGVQCDPPLVSKLDGLKLAQGQRLRLETPGGGGYGRARERDPAAVAMDVRLGYVTARAAEREYAVVVDADGVLDVEATRKLRGG